MKRSRGFTLIEVMITLAIVGVLAAVAYPAYGRYLVRSNRAAAQLHLIDIAQTEQQYLTDNRAYASTLTALNMTTPTQVSQYYTISIAVDDGPPPGFTITATPVDGSMQAGDSVLTINQAGTKTPSSVW